MIVKRLLPVALALLSVAVWAATDREEAMRERLQPLGSLCLAGDACASAPVASSATSGPKTPEEVYNGFCMVCHATGVTESPILGNAEQWAPRLEQGVETLYTHALQGFNAMPMKGTCMACSDDEIKATVDWMLEKLP